MINKLKIVVLLIVVVMLTACPLINNDYDFEYHTIVGTTPVNLEELNTEFDDFNSDLPFDGRRQSIYFSSNRNSSGENFDFIFKNIDVSYHEKDEIVDFDLSAGEFHEFDKKLLALVNTEADQLGPFFVEGLKGTNYFFYAENDSGNFNIKVIHTPRLDWGTYNAQKRLFGPVNLKGINSESDDYYPTLNQECTQMWFCSNRENGQFDIYTLQLNPEEYLYDYLNKTDLAIAREETLSGDSDDKCPIIFGEFMIFTSNRSAGSGGFDLYYSKRVNNRWTTPVNFGPKINSSADEYRPFPFYIGDKPVMIFSSNRTGGKGGFDLYAVRINELIE